MNNSKFIDLLAHISGGSRKDVIEVLKIMSNMPEVKNKLNNKNK